MGHKLEVLMCICLFECKISLFRSGDSETPKRIQLRKRMT